MNFAHPNLSLEEARATPLGYREEIDGLRAVAVLPVLFYHAFPTAVPGGFYGVDIFFVISGYLITGIIHKQMLSNSFSIADFYARRIRRIFPALIAVVLVTFLIAWFLLPPRELKSLGTNIAGGAVFIQNFILLGQVGYFDLAAEKKPLLHLWSLAIEEQYYIVWPLLLMLIGAWRRWSLAITIALAVASFIACLIVQPRAPDYAFYLPVTRAWELLVGSGLALWVNGRSVEARPQPLIDGPMVRELIALVAMLAIVIAFWRFGRLTPHPGVRTLLPVLGAAALIATSGTLVHRYVLSSTPAVFVGLISYPLYLWHYPLMAYARIQFVDQVPAWVMIAIIAASLLLAFATYRFIERPIRFGRRRVPLKVGSLLGGMAALGIVGVIADRSNGWPARIPAEIRGFMLDGSETAFRWRNGKCLLMADQSTFAPECLGTGRRPLVAVWGDSYAASLYPGLAQFGAERGFDVAEFAISACAPLIGYVNAQRPLCKPSNDAVLRHLTELKPDVVIFYGTWRASDDEVRAGLERTIPLVKEAGVPTVVIVGPPPTWQGDGLPANMLDYYFRTRTVLPERTWFRTVDEWTKPFDAFLAAQAKRLGADYVSLRQFMCDDNGCLTRIGPNASELTTFDSGHLTYPASLLVARHVLDTVPGLPK
ncbi:acyltransferase family protein [Bradyrhizobium sp. 83012]|uniref:Acyltransferase family protein n=1 Tax=Bradyrhizobium aeschynomenes TaxID=2734909 RepID=A0ABX2CHG2_9BRAD|nr:acyltransferase family protein [Bradyrhizobium aeschynomenes]NPU67656.1 acyltransferase family protein [Bradyrhizobium aeschynomenes]